MKKIIMTENAPKALGPYSQSNYGWNTLYAIVSNTICSRNNDALFQKISKRKQDNQ